MYVCTYVCAHAGSQSGSKLSKTPARNKKGKVAGKVPPFSNEPRPLNAPVRGRGKKKPSGETVMFQPSYITYVADTGRIPL